MKSIRAASAALAAGMLCNVAYAGFPHSSLAPAGGPAAQYPAYVAQNQQHAQAQPGYGQPVPNYYGQPAANYGPVAQTSCNTGHCGGAPAYGAAPAPPVYQSAPLYAGAPSGPACDPATNYPVTPYASAMSAPWTAPAVLPTPNAGCPTWFGGVYGLIMTREDDDPYYFGVSDTDLSRLYLRSTEATTEYSGGIEARIGRTFDCCRWGIEGVYWGFYPDAEYATITAPNVPGMLMTKMDYSQVYANMIDPMTGMPVGMPATNYTSDLQMIRIDRDFEVHNVEINLISGPLTAPPRNCGPCGPGGACGYAIGDACNPCGPVAPVFRPRLNVGWVFGVRYFKFDENIFVAMDRADQMIDYPGMPNEDELFHEVDVENNLVGVQWGVNMNYAMTRCFSLDVGTKFGLFGNRMSQYQRVFNMHGPAYVLPTMPTDLAVSGTDEDVSFLGEIRAGVGYKVSKHIRLTGGYRAVAITGVATAVDQFEHGREMAALWKVADVERTSDLILHGAYAGLDFAW